MGVNLFQYKTVNKAHSVLKIASYGIPILGGATKM
jgi:hypothetical protein